MESGGKSGSGSGNGSGGGGDGGGDGGGGGRAVQAAGRAAGGEAEAGQSASWSSSSFVVRRVSIPPGTSDSLPRQPSPKRGSSVCCFRLAPNFSTADTTVPHLTALSRPSRLASRPVSGSRMLRAVYRAAVGTLVLASMVCLLRLSSTHVDPASPDHLHTPASAVAVFPLTSALSRAAPPLFISLPLCFLQLSLPTSTLCQSATLCPVHVLPRHWIP